MYRKNQCAGISDRYGLWLSPLPLVQNFGGMGLTLPYNKTDAALSVAVGEAYLYTGFRKVVLFLMGGSFCIALYVFFFTLSYLTTAETIRMFFFTIFSPFGMLLLFSPFLLYFFYQTYNDVPIHFHRQKREVLFLRRNRKLGKTECLIVPWEEVLATTRHFYRINPFGFFRRAYLAVGAEDPARPGKWWYKKKLTTLHNAHSRMQWTQICRFMELGPEYLYPYESLEDTEALYKKVCQHCRPMPDFVNDWLQPIPEEKWRKPSIRLQWYNAYLLSAYRMGKSFLDFGNAGKNIAYPGDEEAARQLQEDMLEPVRGKGWRMPSIPPGAYPPPRSGTQP